jgi:hypothetical protein
MSAAHDLLARPAPARAAIGPETVVALVPPRWRWRVITPGQWRLLSRLGRRTRVRDLVPPAGAGVAEVVELVTELVAAGFLVPEERADPAADGSAAESTAEPATTDGDPATGSAPQFDADRTGGQSQHDEVRGLPADPAGAEPVPPSPGTNHQQQPVAGEMRGESGARSRVAPDVDRVGEPIRGPVGDAWVVPGARLPAGPDVDRVTAPVVEPPPDRQPRPAWVDPADALGPAPPAGVRPYVPEALPPRAAGAHRAERAEQVHPSVEEVLHRLPRREPGRALSPIANVLQQRHDQLRRTSVEESEGPDTETLRRLLGSLQQMEDHGSAERGGAG